jgi:hypothetical protein
MGKQPTDVAVWHRVYRQYMWDANGGIRFTDAPKFLPTLSKAKARVRADYGLDLTDVEFRTRAEIEALASKKETVDE